MASSLLEQPRVGFIPEKFGLNPKTSQGDRWLVNGSRDDAVLLGLLLAKEDLGAMHANGEEIFDKYDADDQTHQPGANASKYERQMNELGAQIIAREGFLDKPS